MLIGVTFVFQYPIAYPLIKLATPLLSSFSLYLTLYPFEPTVLRNAIGIHLFIYPYHEGK